MGLTLRNILCIIANILSCISIILSIVILYKSVKFEGKLTDEYIKQIKKFYNFSIGIVVFIWLVTVNKITNLGKSVLYINAVGWLALFIIAGVLMLILNLTKSKSFSNANEAVKGINQSIPLFLRNAVISIFLAWFIGI
ncbi:MULTISPECIES: hypothetical protein [Clostridium]|uniref:hypothetical protein n=1 Tax=Clostridium TaxID=1485 RepID=UPI0008260E7B|nr:MULTISPECIES: hypothetical protein [Clostridium]PJI06843.1 hypothetical protein CUB90_02705 [Clostridium sp. CT7]